jgi:hypothetical protein
MTRAALGPEPLTRNAHATARTRRANRDSSLAFVFYTACAVAAAWVPLTIAVTITVVWTGWLVYGIRLKED